MVQLIEVLVSYPTLESRSANEPRLTCRADVNTRDLNEQRVILDVFTIDNVLALKLSVAYKLSKPQTTDINASLSGFHRRTLCCIVPPNVL